MKIYCDSSTKEACIVIEGQDPEIIPYEEALTVNQGEYRAVILALELALKLRLWNIFVLSDSLLVVNQVNGLWRCRKEHLIPFRNKVKELAQKVRATVIWTSREFNLAGKVLE